MQVDRILQPAPSFGDHVSPLILGAPAPAHGLSNRNPKPKKPYLKALEALTTHPEISLQQKESRDPKTVLLSRWKR